MVVTSTYSSRLRERMTPEDWAAIRDAGPGECRFGRGFGGSFVATLRSGNAVAVAAHRTSPRAAFDAALRDLRSAPEIVSVLS